MFSIHSKALYFKTTKSYYMKSTLKCVLCVALGAVLAYLVIG